MITRCFIGVDVVVVGVEELPAAVPAKDIVDANNPDNSMDSINSDICSIFFIDQFIS